MLKEEEQIEEDSIPKDEEYTMDMKGDEYEKIVDSSQLQARIEETRSAQNSVIPLFIICLFWDILSFLVNAATAGLGWSVLNGFVVTGFFIYFFFKSSRVKTKLIRIFWTKMLLKFLPEVSFFPLYTISAIQYKLSLDKDLEKYEGKLMKFLKFAASI